MSFKQWLESAVRQGTSRWVDPALIDLAAKQRRQGYRSCAPAQIWRGLEPLESRVLLTATPTIVGLATPDDVGTGPSIQSIVRTNPAGSTTTATSVTYTVTFSEAVAGVDPTDFTVVKTGTVTASTPGVSGSGSVYTVTIGGISGSGTLGLNLVDDHTIHDTTGNGLVIGGAATFQPQATFATGASPFSLTTADVNGDGKADLIVTTGSLAAPTVSVLLGNGNGTFQSPATFAVSSPITITTADVNGDGKADLIVGNYNSNTVGVLLGNGNGTFKPQVTYATGNHPRSVTTADVNGDGKVDLIVVDGNNSTISVLLGNGNGTFQPQATFTGGTGMRSVTTADVNGDGKPDLIVTNQYDYTAGVLLGNGNGTFQPQTTFATGYGPYSVTAADVNGDGIADLIVANQSDNTISVLLGYGDGTFHPQVTYATGNDPNTVTTADVNGDGKADLIVTNQNDNNVSVLLGNGNGTFQPQTTFATGSYPGSMATADVNGDGKADLIVTNVHGNTVSVLRNNGNGSIIGPVYTIDSFAPPAPTITGLAAADDTGVSSSDRITSKNTGLQINGTAEANSTITLFSGTTLLGGATTNESGNWTVDIGTKLADNTYSLTAKASDAGVNISPASSPLSLTVDSKSPSVESIVRTTPAGTTTNAASVTYTVTFSEAVTGVDPTDFTVVKTGTVAASTPVVSGSGASYTVTIPGISGNGTLGLNLVDDHTIRDVAGNELVTPGGAASFQTQTAFVEGSDPDSVTTADVNHDGKADLIVANFEGGTVSVLLGNGNGTFQPQVTYATGYGAVSVTTADVNGDNKADLIVANSGSNTISVLLGNGNGTFQPQATYATGSYPRSVTVADVNGDGKADLIVANVDSSNVSVLLGKGDGTFQPQATFATGSDPFSVTTADANGDNKVDLIVANREGGTVSVLLGKGDGTFQPQVTYATGSYPNSVTTADVNGDGKADLIVANDVSNFGDGTVGVLLGNGNGTFQAQATFATGSDPGPVKTVDVNGDNKVDLIVANEGDNTVGVLLGNGNGTFQPQATFATAGFPTSVTTADVNGDNKVDLIVANKFSSTVGVLLGNGDGTFQPQATFAAGFGLNPVTTADLNGDGKADLIVVGSSTVGVLLGNGDGTFQPQATFAAGLALNSVTTSDVNGDGKADLIVTGGTFGNAVSVLLGNGDGTFQPPATFATYVGGAVTTADVNGDGKADLIVAGYNTVGVLLGNGNGTFQPQITSAAGNDSYSVTTADVNGDGKADLIVTNNNISGTVGVLLGNGNGTFQSQVTYATGSYPSSVTVADVNGDGKADVVVANRNSNSVGVLLGNGNGTFLPQVTYATGYSPSSVTTADVNGDGKADLVVANRSDDDVSVLLGNGDGTFQPQATFQSQATFAGAGNQPFSVAATDVNGDGKTDLIVANENGGTVSVLLNNTSGDSVTGPVYTIDSHSPPTAPGIVGLVAADDTGVSNSDDVTSKDTGLRIHGTADPFINIQLFSGTTLLGSTSADGSGNWAVNIATRLADNTYSLTAKAIDVGNNVIAVSNPQSLTIDSTNPSVESIARTNPAGPATTATSVTYTVTFSEPVIGVDATDFTVAATGTVASSTPEVSGSGSVYTVTIGGVSGNGTLGLNLVDDQTIRDTAGNELVTAGAAASFQTQTAFVEGTDPSSVTTADVNHDDKADLIVANRDGGTVSVLLGNGDGTFQPQVTYATGSYPNSVTTADVNGDDKADLIVANTSSNTVSVLLGNGNGTFQPQVTFATGGEPDSVTTADVNGDNKVDLVVANVGSNSVGVLLGNGNGTFQSQATFATGFAPSSVATADVNGDNKVDLIVANAGNGTVSVLLGNGNGTFQPQATFATGSDSDSVTTADVNGDNKVDLIVANNGSNSVGVLLGNGDGTFQPQVTFATGSEPDSVTTADVNGDNKVDLVVANEGSNSVSVLLGNGNGIFQPQVTFGARGGAVTTADVNGDHKTDLIVVNFDSVGVLLGNGDGTFQPQTTFAAGSALNLVTTADLNGDGNADLIVANEDSNNVGVLLGNGDGTFQPQATFATGNLPFSVTTADVNEDGKADLIVANTNSNNVGVLLGNGDGTFQPQTTFATGPLPESVTTTDVNGDGKTDLIVANSGYNTVSVLLGNGNGTFQPQATFATEATPYLVTTADVNGDGKVDLIVANREGRTVSVLLGNGDGTFQPQATFAAGSDPYSVTTADVNGDGKADLIVTNTEDSTIGVLLGNGDGTFQMQVTFATESYPNSVTTADVNGDGKADLIVASGGYGTVSVLLGNGDGTFQPQATFDTGGAASVTTTDLNGDGKTDLVVGTGRGAVSVLLNNASGDTTGPIYTIGDATPPDTTPPGNVTALNAVAGDAQVALSWSNPADSDLSGVVVVRRAGQAPSGSPVTGTAYSVGNSLAGGTVVFAGSGTGFPDPGLTDGTQYFYEAFAYDTSKNYAPGGGGGSGGGASANATPFTGGLAPSSIAADTLVLAGSEAFARLIFAASGSSYTLEDFIHSSLGTVQKSTYSYTVTGASTATVSVAVGTDQITIQLTFTTATSGTGFINDPDNGDSDCVFTLFTPPVQNLAPGNLVGRTMVWNIAGGGGPNLDPSDITGTKTFDIDSKASLMFINPDGPNTTYSYSYKQAIGSTPGVAEIIANDPGDPTSYVYLVFTSTTGGSFYFTDATSSNDLTDFSYGAFSLTAPPAPPPVLATTAGSLNYAQGSGAVAIDPGLKLTDTGSATINSAAVQITQNFASAEDALNFTAQSGITGTFDSTSGTLTLTGAATLAQYQNALRSVTYQDTSASPSILARTVAFTVTDANNDTSNAATRDITVNLFGATSTGKTVTLTLPAGNGTTATFTLAGGGSAEVTTITNADTTKSFDLTITGATGKSAVTITSKSVGQAAGMIQLHDITVTAPVSASAAQSFAALASTDSLVHAAAAAPNPLVLKSFTATNGVLVGKFEVQGAIQTIKIGEVDGGTIKIDAPSSSLNVAPLVLTIPLEIKNGSIDSAIPIKSLTTIDWIDDQAPDDIISAPSIGTITTTGNKKSGFRGDFQADVTGPDGATALTSAKIAGSLTGVTWSLKNVAPTIQVGGSAGNMDHPVTINAAAIKSLKVGGDLDHANIQLSQAVDLKNAALGTLAVTGTLRNSVITSVGVVNAVTLGAMDHSQLLIGDGGFTGLAPDQSTFAAQPLKPNLLNFTIKGLVANQPSLTASIIDAWNIGKVSLKFVDSNPEPDLFGFSAGLIGAMSFQAQGINGGKPVTLKNLDFDVNETLADQLLDPKKNPGKVTLAFPIGSFTLSLV